MKSDDIATPKVIGSNVRKKRHERHWSLDELAESSGVSKATLSQIESGRVNPTVATLWKIAQSLETELSMLIRSEEETVRTFAVTREGDLPRLTGTSGVKIKVLSPITLAGELEFYFLTLDPGAVLASEAHEPGSHEMITVISGTLDVEAGRNSIRLNAGDVLNYQCDISHRISNPGTEPATLHMVVKF
ncbi:MAG: helix-turn-helix domain-containing protein [Lentisphaerae bacterium]|nr:helix-turn-helix domain-containing protein [Lentisphaerota bacterium]MBR2873331.1 helix-turn-helix transcriptional regulator [Lentisphaeria bacterium]